MRKRNIRIKFRLDEKEAERLNKRAMQNGLSRSGYIRQILDSIPNTDAPLTDYATFAEKLRPIGESFNKIARKAHVLNVIDRQRYDETFAAHNEVVAEILRAVMLFRSFGRGEE